MVNIKDKYLTFADYDDLKNGFLHDAAGFTCIYCGKNFNEGEIYPAEGRFFTALRAVKSHVAETHGDVFMNLLGLGKDLTGISEAQEAILRLSYQGYTDKEIASRLGGRSASTVRNHRFQLRKKSREAKVFLAVMGLLEAKGRIEEGFVDFHGDLPVHDDRTVVTEEEAAAMLEKYFSPGNPPRLNKFPKKQKEKLVVLNRLAELFDTDRRYNEKEINEVLLSSFEDYVTIRRYMIDYGFLGRKPDGSAYWRK